MASFNGHFGRDDQRQSDPDSESSEAPEGNRNCEILLSVQDTFHNPNPIESDATTTGKEAKERDAVRHWLLEIAEDNPINLDIVFQNGNFPTRKAAAVWLNRQEANGNLICVGLMKDKQGRLSMKVYCNGWKPKQDNLRHEIIGTRIRLLYQGYGFLRGYKVTECLADMVMTDGVHTFEIEIDCGTLKQKQMTWRWKRHKCTSDILVITAPKSGNPEARLSQILRWSDDLGDRAFFTTLERLNHGAHERVWEFIGRGKQELKMLPTPVASSFIGNTVATP